MRIEHIAIWVEDLEKMRQFYLDYFDASSSEKYVNPKKGYSSYFISFGSGDSRIEIMNRDDIAENPLHRGYVRGLAHISIEVGNVLQVGQMTEKFRADGYTIESEPRRTGDGYYESVILDPEGNLIEIVES